MDPAARRLLIAALAAARGVSVWEAEILLEQEREAAERAKSGESDLPLPPEPEA